MRLRAPRRTHAPGLVLPALLALALVAAKLAWWDSEELDRLRSGMGVVREALARLADPDAHRPPLVRVELGAKARRKLDSHVARSLALGGIPHGDDDWVRAKLDIDGRRSRALVRLKGDFPDHLEKGISLRVKLRGDLRLWGMRTFNLQHPNTRYYLNEYAFIEAARREGLLAPLHEFVRFALDDESPRPYLLIEHFSKELLERQGRREGVIVKFDESDLFGGKLEKRARLGPDVVLHNRPEDAALDVIGEGSIDDSPELSEQRSIALARFDEFRHGRVRASDTFDVDVVARWLALTELFGAQHGLDFHNPRYYYDPVRGRFEPFAWDGNAGPCWPEQHEAWVEHHGGFAWERFFADPEVGRAFSRELWRMTEPAYVEGLLHELEPALAARARFLLADPDFRRDVRSHTNFGWVPAHARWIRERMRGAEIPGAAPGQPGAPARVRLVRAPEGGTTLLVEARASSILELEELRGADGHALRPKLRRGDPPWTLLPLPPHPKSHAGPRVAAFRLPAGLPPLREVVLRVAGAPEAGRWTLPLVAQRGAAEAPAPVAPVVSVALRAEPAGLVRAAAPPAPALPPGWELREEAGLAWATAPPGESRLERDLVLPRGFGLRLEAGTRLRVAPAVAIVVEGPVEMAGSEAAPVVLTPSADAWDGLVVLDAGRSSRLAHARIEGVEPEAGTRGPRRAGWMQTGGVVFVQSDVSVSHVVFRHFGTEDALNAVRSRVELRDVRFEDVASDAFDGDFVTGTLERVTLLRAGGDGVDVSGSRIALHDVAADGVRDKAVSVGEASEVEIDGLEANGGAFGVVAKDGSLVRARRVAVHDTWVALAAFTKKPEFGPARLEASALRLSGRSFAHLAQAGSEIVLDGRRLPARRFDSKDLYATR